VTSEDNLVLPSLPYFGENDNSTAEFFRERGFEVTGQGIVGPFWLLQCVAVSIFSTKYLLPLWVHFRALLTNTWVPVTNFMALLAGDTESMMIDPLRIDTSKLIVFAVCKYGSSALVLFTHITDVYQMCMYASNLSHTHTHTPKLVRVRTYTHTQTHTQTHSLSHESTHTHTQTHTHTHTHTHTLISNMYRF